MLSRISKLGALWVFLDWVGYGLNLGSYSSHLPLAAKEYGSRRYRSIADTLSLGSQRSIAAFTRIENALISGAVSPPPLVR